MTAEDTSVAINVVANDSDSDGHPRLVIATSNPANGSVQINADNTVTCASNADFDGPAPLVTEFARDGQAAGSAVQLSRPDRLGTIGVEFD